MIATHLRAHGFEALHAGNGLQAKEIATTQLPCVILLDLMLPQLSGLEVCKALKSQPETAAIPIIMLSAKSDEIDRVVGFELGAVDYVTKPFSPRELMLRIKVALQRQEVVAVPANRLTHGNLTLDRDRHEVLVRGEPVNCTPTEFMLLKVLMERRGRVQARESLLNDVWGYENLIDTRTVDTHMRRLREKLAECGDYIETVRGFGYRFVEGPAL